MLNIDRSTVKHGTQNIHMTALEWTVRPGPHWGSLQRSPRPLAGLKSPTSKAEEQEREREKREKKGRRREREGPAPGSALWTAHWKPSLLLSASYLLK